MYYLWLEDKVTAALQIEHYTIINITAILPSISELCKLLTENVGGVFSRKKGNELKTFKKK